MVGRRVVSWSPAVFSFVIVTACFYGGHEDIGRFDELGCEHDAIARALREGRGFSDPFAIGTGPTAWMAPVFPCVLVTLYWATNDDRVSVVNIVRTAQLVFVWGVGVAFLCSTSVMELGARTAIFAAVLYIDARFIIEQAGDIALYIAIVAILHRYLLVLRVGSTPQTVLWGIFGGITFLSSPVLGFMWICGTIAKVLAEKSWRAVPFAVVSLLLAALVVMPWIIRTQNKVGCVYPIKSNGGYELWQSQCVDDDGVLDGTTLAKHPYVGYNEQRQEYRTIGEHAFVEMKASEALVSISEDPRGYIWRVKNRTSAILWGERSESLSTKLVRATLTACIVVLLVFRQPTLPSLITLVLFASFVLPYAMISVSGYYLAQIFQLKLKILEAAILAREDGLKA